MPKNFRCRNVRAVHSQYEGNRFKPLRWHKHAIYLSHENALWSRKNPAWNNQRTNAGFERILEDLKKGFRKNQKTWKRLLEQVPLRGSRTS